ncbi:MarR family transcriptional regulator [Methanothermobacter sp. KEPCO-1]|uniref:MarR family transcriptional regulator n=1 Tax=Methanothermobacter sp. KEPCO-1 TaxID=2603820 RepID=UPI0011CA8894|nr:MarR family transcriptional regulator [Methanothermobacter sp. KEPCO-1]QEF93813.1 MarR family transcriptional regulator [Methanothermobacter sp. KEPCO-1]
MIDSDIPFKGLLSIILRSHRVFVARELSSLKLTDAQVACLFRIHRQPGVTQDELSWFFQVDKGTIARITRRLEEKGLIIKKQDPQNRRRYRLNLTDQGEELIPLIREVEKRWTDLLFENLTQEEQDELMRMCRRLAEGAMKIRGVEDD